MAATALKPYQEPLRGVLPKAELDSPRMLYNLHEPEATAEIFLCYRRDDTLALAGRLWDRLAAHFGEEHVFIDLDSIQPGDNFVENLADRLERADVMVVLIGARWLNGESGMRRIDDLADYVRYEITFALSRGIPVIPVLGDGAEMPRRSDVPESIG